MPDPSNLPQWTVRPLEPDRRNFLKLSALGATAMALFPGQAMAGPFTREDFTRLVPEDKKLAPDWIKSLFERGKQTVYRGVELEKIGIPIGGLCAGQLYLGGDGKLWHWDIFNRPVATGAGHYANPMTPQSPLEQGFALQITANGQTQTRRMDASGWRGITFNGEYPLAFLEYQDPEAPVKVKLEAFSPFIPLNTDDSSLPATVMRFTVQNTSGGTVDAELAGWLENAVCRYSAERQNLLRRNRIVQRDGMTMLDCSAEAAPPAAPGDMRPDIVFDDFERDTHEGWTVTGTAFGAGPLSQKQIMDYQGAVGFHGERGINSHAAAPGQDVTSRDAQKGVMLSRAFIIERHFITFLIGGGPHKGKTCVNLLVDGKAVLSATGPENNRMRPHSLDVRPWTGKSAQIQVVDDESGAWGNIGIDHIVFSDRPRVPVGPLQEEQDFGTMGLALLPTEGPRPEGLEDRANALLPDVNLPGGLFSSTGQPAASGVKPGAQKLLGALTRKFALKAGESATATFLVVWHFPNLRMDRLPPGRYYGTRFKSALEVAEYLGKNFTTLRQQTHLWHDTWYDSTLPFWFLDRTFLNISILATSTAHRFANGRFWGWEGVGCCHGTCGHVWQYAQAMARLFPDLERDTRERVDFGLALQKDGAIHFRAEFNNIPAVDGQAGTILRALREHQMTPSDAWLRKNWPGIKRATEWLIAKDADGDGVITGSQHNTLDTDWFGPVAWLSGMYLAALRAAEEMAGTVGDAEFARRCREIFERGQKNLTAQLFDGEYFINKPDPQRLDAINSGTGCHIDQVFGQSWAGQVGLGRILPEKETVLALKSLWKYNFTPDVGPYREAYKAGRWYAMPGEGGLLMCSFPRKDWDYAQAKGKGPDWAAGYFNECMNGFEYQAAWHMIAEGLVMEGLAVTRMIHDRYHPLRRNPWNEIECGDHYARSMASYGVFLAAAGHQYDGPRGRLEFAPQLTPENFKCAFTTAAGWGSYRQSGQADKFTAALDLKWGQLTLNTLVLAPRGNPRQVAVALAGQAVPAQLTVRNGRAEIAFATPVNMKAGDALHIQLS